MTDRHSGYLVVLEENIREDDAKATIDALKMVKGVATVTPVVANVNEAIGEERTKLEFKRKLIETFLK